MAGRVADRPPAEPERGHQDETIKRLGGALGSFQAGAGLTGG